MFLLFETTQVNLLSICFWNKLPKQNIREHVYIVNIAGVEQVMFKTGI